MSKLSVIIITLNEEKNLSRALASVKFADEVIVVDSFSQDQTCKIAADFGAKVFQRAFDGHGQQKNFALDQCTGDWIFWLDADEEVTKELHQSIEVAITRQEYSTYAVNRRTRYLEKWIYHGGWYPDLILRLFKKDAGRFSTPHIHEKFIPNNTAPQGQLSGHLNHYSFTSISQQVQKNLHYAQLGSKELLKTGGPSAFKLLVKPPGKFLECYLLKAGFLDGWEGFIIAVNAAYSLFLKYSIAYREKKSHGL